ncbi:MAG: electron transport complex subunit RsxE [Xanthomonadaceae bacterium]|nr:electron transport complex subunit RsxE [Xanthomonadaceae bacterium]MDP2184501.1 electron transport complex subunit RsxE [Xanthomonadales bacterium]MDZ4115379.1 electron transport complex subunit RsxE [Xanthomonadaceae bacterium]MDZ4378526.1 electron transport complex subunit RsxE [Xanthomonadaceae bacterium]
MTNPSAKSILEYGLVSGNTGLVQLLGLCPLLAVSNNAVNALGLGLASLLALTLTNTVVASLRRLSRRDVRIPAFVTIIASVVTAIELSLRAWWPELYQVLGLFVPLIVTNCAIMGRAEAFASRHNPARAALDGFAFGLGFLWVLLLIGVVRELVGTGMVFAGSGTMLGMPWLELTVLGDYHGFLPAILPPGAFIVLALLIAWRNRRQNHVASAPVRAPTAIPAT